VCKGNTCGCPCFEKKGSKQNVQRNHPSHFKESLFIKKGNGQTTEYRGKPYRANLFGFDKNGIFKKGSVRFIL
jgi:hypothetical protein